MKLHQPQPSNINQLNQQLITKHKDEVSNLTNIIEEKDTIIDQLIEDRIEHKQQPINGPTTTTTKNQKNTTNGRLQRKHNQPTSPQQTDNNIQTSDNIQPRPTNTYKTTKMKSMNTTKSSY